MGNRIYIDEVYKPESKLYGFHAYDDYESATEFHWEETPDDDKDWFFDIIVKGGDESFLDLIQFAREMEKGIEIRGTYYDWGELDHTYQMARYAAIADIPPSKNV